MVRLEEECALRWTRWMTFCRQLTQLLDLGNALKSSSQGLQHRSLSIHSSVTRGLGDNALRGGSGFVPSTQEMEGARSRPYTATEADGGVMWAVSGLL